MYVFADCFGGHAARLALRCHSIAFEIQKFALFSTECFHRYWWANNTDNANVNMMYLRKIMSNRESPGSPAATSDSGTRWLYLHCACQEKWTIELAYRKWLPPRGQMLAMQIEQSFMRLIDQSKEFHDLIQITVYGF